MTKRTPEEIVKILNSIVQVNVDDGYIEVLFDDSGNYGPSSKRAFVPGSFTRKLLELIEDHLCNDDLCLSCDARELKYRPPPVPGADAGENCDVCGTAMLIGYGFYPWCEKCAEEENKTYERDA